MKTDHSAVKGWLFLPVLIASCNVNEALADCTEFLSRSEKEKSAFLTGWMTGTAMVTRDEMLNGFSTRTQLLVEARQPCKGNDCDIVSSAAYAIGNMRARYRNGLLASLFRDQFDQAVDDYCESPSGPGTPISEAISVALGNMAYSGNYSLLSFGVVVNSSERVAEMYSSRSKGGTIGGGRSISEPGLSKLCGQKNAPVELRGPESVSISVGDEFGLNNISVDAYDRDGGLVLGLPLRVREVEWSRSVKRRLTNDTRYVRYRALQPGEQVFEILPLCADHPKLSKTFRLIVSKPYVDSQQ